MCVCVWGGGSLWGGGGGGPGAVFRGQFSGGGGRGWMERIFLGHSFLDTSAAVLQKYIFSCKLYSKSYLSKVFEHLNDLQYLSRAKT